MWQSKMWNGQDAAFRMFTVIGIILLFVAQPETKHSPDVQSENSRLPATLLRVKSMSSDDDRPGQ
jgi:hypothetical protein